jgi:hypothetical protein
MTASLRAGSDLPTIPHFRWQLSGCELAFETADEGLVNKQGVKARQKAGLPKDLILHLARHDLGTYMLQKTGNFVAGTGGRLPNGQRVLRFTSTRQALPIAGHGCPGDNESAGVSHSHRSPKGNRPMRRILNQAGNAAARTNGSIFQIVYRRQVPRMGHNQAIGVIAHRLCQLIWILHTGKYVMRNGAQRLQKRRSESAPPEWSANSGPSVTESKH